MRSFKTLCANAAVYATLVNADAATHSPSLGSANAIQYAISVPSSTASSGSGNVYFQISAPSTYQWVAMGVGSEMAGSTMFVVYADGNGNVTVSPRAGQGEYQPSFSSDIASQTELLAGSGIANGMMIANVKYTTSSSTLQVTSSAASFIGAWKSGAALNMASQSATVTKHDAHDTWTFDLTKASIATDANPFVAAAPAGTPTASSSGGTTATLTSAAVSSPTIAPVVAGGSSSSSSSSGDPSGDDPMTTMYQQSHGIIMSLAMVVLFPVGAIIMALFGWIWVHAAIQVVGVILVIAGYALGSRLGKMTDIHNVPHTTFGTVIFVLFLIQPFGGLLHHWQYKRLGHRSYFGYIHLWFGRILIICGMINGGLGLQLADNTVNGEIAYGVVAGVIGLVYLAIAGFTCVKGKKGSKTAEVESASPKLVNPTEKRKTSDHR